jgi:hypothetical protein
MFGRGRDSQETKNAKFATVPEGGIGMTLAAVYSLGDHNTESPRIRLMSDRIDYEIKSKGSMKFDNIKSIDASAGPFGRAINILPKEGRELSLMPIGEDIIDIIRFFNARDLPLSPTLKAVIR